MLTTGRAFNGFSTDDIDAAKAFYRDVLGVAVAEDHGMLTLLFTNGQRVLVYPKPDHEPATYTALNFIVEDIDATVGDLRSAGVQFESYPWTDNGIQRGYGPPIAWFKDPAGNILSVLEEPPAAPEIGSIILSSADPDRLRAWYVEVFAPEVHEGFLQLGMVGVQIVSRDGISPTALDPSRILVNLHVTDIDRFVQRLDERHVEWVARADQRPDGWFATFADPDGNHVQLIELSEDYWRRR
jgi:predicted enzyme related to lactoylglutathione lyase